MNERTFVWGYDKQYDTNGWIPKGMPEFNAGTGMTIAHDMLEHADYDDETIEGEMQAFGASLFVRFNGGYWPKHVNFYEPATPTTCEFLHEKEFKVGAPPDVGNINRYNEHQLDMLQDRVLYAFAIAALPHLAKMPEMDVVEQAVENAIGWMRVGFKRAQERYAGHTTKEVCGLYKRIERDIDSKYKHADFGDELRVAVSPQSLEYTIDYIKK